MIGWGTPEQVAAACGLSRHTVRTWTKRGVVATACSVASRRLLVRWADVYDRAERLRDTPRNAAA